MPTLQDYYNNKYQYALEDYNTSTPEGDRQAVSSATGYIPELLDLRQKVESGQASDWDREWYNMQAKAAMAVPMRDPRSLTYNAGEDAPERVSAGSPDLGRLMLTLQDKMRQGTATPQDSNLFQTTYKALVEQNYRASVPQASDANPFGLGDNLFGALMTVGLGATGGLAAAPLAAGGAGLSTTLGSLGTLSGIAGTGAGVLGQATDQEWLKQLGMGLGAAGGIAGGIGGLANLANRGVTSLGDAARLASSAGRVVGGVGAIADNDALKQAGGWLGTAGQLGGGVENLMNLVGGTGGSLQGALGLVSPLRKLAGQFMQPGSSAAPQQRPTAMARPVTAAPQQPLYGAPAPGSWSGAGVQASPQVPVQGAGGIQALLQAAQQAQRLGLQGQVQPTMSNQDWMRWNWQAPQAAPQSTLWNL